MSTTANYTKNLTVPMPVKFNVVDRVGIAECSLMSRGEPPRGANERARSPSRVMVSRIPLSAMCV